MTVTKSIEICITKEDVLERTKDLKAGEAKWVYFEFKPIDVVTGDKVIINVEGVEQPISSIMSKDKQVKSVSLNMIKPEGNDDGNS